MTSIINYTLPYTDYEVLTYVIEQSNSDRELKRNQIISLFIIPHKCRESEIDVECSICQDKFKTFQKLSTLTGCQHTFHFSCIKEWGKYKGECPLCRYKIPILER